MPIRLRKFKDMGAIPQNEREKRCRCVEGSNVDATRSSSGSATRASHASMNRREKPRKNRSFRPLGGSNENIQKNETIRPRGGSRRPGQVFSDPEEGDLGWEGKRKTGPSRRERKEGTWQNFMHNQSGGRLNGDSERKQETTNRGR